MQEKSTTKSRSDIPPYKPPHYWASRCPCMRRSCRDWHVEPVAALQGVSFTEAQARAVAKLLNDLNNQEW